MPDTMLRLRDLTEETAFELTPDAETRAAIAIELGILKVRKLRFSGRVIPDGARDWRLSGDLGATVDQACVVTLDPVTSRIDAPVERKYLADMPDLPEGDEIEMPEDDSVEPLPAELDLAQVMIEALALELPPWPRADGVDPVDVSVTEPGKEALTDDDVKPFAALKSLKEKLDDTDE